MQPSKQVDKAVSHHRQCGGSLAASVSREGCDSQPVSDTQ